MKLTPIFAAGFAFTILFPSIERAAECHKSGDMETVIGIIHMKTLPPDPDMNRTKPWTYSVITFDRPVCVKDADFGDVPNGEGASVVFDPNAKRRLAEGQHVSLRDSSCTGTTEVSHPSLSCYL
jgi:hypothetical protein